MKKWDEQQRMKNYQNTIKNAKPGLNSKKQTKTPNIKARSNDTSTSQRSMVSDYYESEKDDLTKIPLYRLLKMYNLQQYAKELISRGFGYDLCKLSYLSQTELQLLMEEIKCLPGHRAKLIQLFEYINELFPQVYDFQSYQSQSPQYEKKGSLLQPKRNNTLSKNNSTKQMQTQKLTNFPKKSNTKNKVSPYALELAQNKQFQQSQKKTAPHPFYQQQRSSSQEKNQNFNQTSQFISTSDKQSNRVLNLQNNNNNNNNKNQQNIQRIQQIGGDFFMENEQQQDEFQATLQNIMQRYSSPTNLIQQQLHIDKQNMKKQLLGNTNQYDQKENLQKQTIQSEKAIQQIHNNQEGGTAHTAHTDNNNFNKFQSEHESNTTASSKNNSNQIKKQQQQQQQLISQEQNNNKYKQQDNNKVKKIEEQKITVSLQKNESKPQQQQQQQQNVNNINQNQQKINQMPNQKEQGAQQQKLQQKIEKSIENNNKNENLHSTANQHDRNLKQNRIFKNLKKNFVEKSDSSIKIELEYDKIKQMYMSFDSGKLTSTLVNLDIEELSFCLASAILKHIEYGTKQLMNESKYISQTWLEGSLQIGNSIKGGQINNQIYSQNAISKSNYPPVVEQQEQDDSENEQQYLENEEGNIYNEQYQQNIEGDDNIDQDYYDKNDPDYQDCINKLDEQYQQKITEQQSEEARLQQNLNYNNNIHNNQDTEQVNFESSRNEIEDILKESLMLRKQEQDQRINEEIQENLSDNNYNEEGEEEGQDDLQNNKQNLNFKKKSSQSGIRKNESLKRRLDSQDQDDDDEDIVYSEEEESEEILYQNNNNDKSSISEAQSIQSEQAFQNNNKNQGKYYNRNVQNQPNKQTQQNNVPADDTMANFSQMSKYTTVVVDERNIESFRSNRRLFDKTYNEQSFDMLVCGTPSKEVVQNFCKNIIIQSKMEKETPIIALVYIERLLLKSGLGLTGQNWRRIAITALIMASKTWDDESFENENFSKAFTQFTTKEINEMERVFLNFIEYSLYVKSSDYAKYYFVLRAFARKDKKSFPLRPLDLKTIIFLQRAGNSSAKQQRLIKETFLNPVNKSF